MKALRSAVRGLWGLFVDDGGLAAALILWCAAAGLALPHLVGAEWRAVALFAGCLAILLVDIGVVARRRGTERPRA